MSYGCSREARQKAAQINFDLMRCGVEPMWQLCYLIEDEVEEPEEEEKTD